MRWGRSRFITLASPKLARANRAVMSGRARTSPSSSIASARCARAHGRSPCAIVSRFAGTTFESWARRSGRIAKSAGGEAVLFQTCYVQNNAPEIGRDTLAVLDANRVDVRCAAGLSCCRMPAWEKGDLAGVQAAAAHNLKILQPFVAAGAKVLAINPSAR
jgi:Fe-S oxidoreductase